MLGLAEMGYVFKASWLVMTLRTPHSAYGIGIRLVPRYENEQQQDKHHTFASAIDGILTSSCSNAQKSLDSLIDMS